MMCLVLASVGEIVVQVRKWDEFGRWRPKYLVAFLASVATPIVNQLDHGFKS